MPGPDSAIAKKHIEISLRAKQIAQRALPGCRVYVATYTTGRSGQSYQQIEEHTGEEFWSIRAITPPPPPHTRIKDLDLIITDEKQVKLLVEVKWGAVPGSMATDLRIVPDEWQKMARLLAAPAMCRVRGPAVRSGRRYRSVEFPTQRDYCTDGQTKLVLVSDFLALQRMLDAEFRAFLSLWKAQKSRVLIADIHCRVGDIPSFQEVVETAR